MSGRAFGAMAVSGQADNLRNAGKVTVQYRRVPCNYPGVPITFHVDSGSNQNYFSTLIEFEDGDGDPLIAPFSIRLTTIESGKVFEAKNVIPFGWMPGQT